jgi:hypothetical protein
MIFCSQKHFSVFNEFLAYPYGMFGSSNVLACLFIIMLQLTLVLKCTITAVNNNNNIATDSIFMLNLPWGIL